MRQETLLSRRPLIVRAFLFSYVVVLSGLVLSTEPSFAQAYPPGEIMDVQPLDEQLICSFYTGPKRSKAIQTYVARADGAKILGKPFWGTSSIATKLTAVRKQIPTLKGNRAKGIKKKLSDLMAQRALLSSMKLQVKQCSSEYGKSEKFRRVVFSHVKNILEKKCVTCHAPLGWQNSDEYFVATGRVVPQSLEGSTLYSRLKNNPNNLSPANMPPGAALPNQEIYLLARYILDKEKAPEATPTPSGTPVNPELEAGRKLLAANGCMAGCHVAGGTAPPLWGQTAASIRAAISRVKEMQSFSSLTDEQLRLMEVALRLESRPIDPTPTPVPGAPPLSEFEKGRILLKNNGCLTGCHVAGGTGGAIFGASSASIKGAVARVSAMKGFAFLSDEELRLMSVGLSVKTSEPKDMNWSVLVGTGNYVTSAFTTIFLPDDVASYTAIDTAIQTKIKNGVFATGKAVHFGGLCDRRFDTSANCLPEVVKALREPSPTVIRAALVIALYDNILSGTTRARAVENALRKINLTPTSTISAETIQALYQLIFAGKPLSASTAAQIATTVQGIPSYSQPDRWAFLMEQIGSTNTQETL